MEELLDKTLGVRIAPGLLHFMDVFVGRTYQANISVQNISHVAKAIKIHGASDPQFTLYVQNPEKPIAPGLQVTASVEYRPSKKEDIHDKLLVVVDNDVIEVPLLGLTPSCCLEIDPEVNFGDLVANSKVIYKEIAVTNHGSSPGTFKIKYSGHLPITISPTSGIVEPKKMQIIKVDLCTDIPAVFEETAKVKLQGHEELLLKIKGNIVNQNLELLDLSGKPLKCLHFGSVYFGTSKIHKAVIYNDSPETISWVSVLDDNAVGAELGTNILESTDAALQDMDYRNRMSDREVSSILTCCPNEGVLLPFQKTTFTVCFSPKPFDEAIRRNDVPSQQDYALFMRFEPIGSKDGFLQSDADSRGHRKGQQICHVELAVTGSAFPVALTFSPGTVYNFKECLIGERIDIHCSLKNESQFLPVVFSFHKISHFHISPANGKIEAGRSQEVMFSFVPHQGGTFTVKQVVDILGPTSDDNLPPLKMKAFHQKKLSFTAVCKPLTKKIVMKINPGITPMISNPTGHFVPVAPQETAVCTGSTRAATLKADKVQIHDHQNTICVDKNVMVAFPNDRATSIRPSDRNTHYRTIFTKVERYNYVDPDYAYTEDEEKLKEAHKDYYTNYIKNRRENRLQEENDREFQEVSNDFDIGITPAARFQPPSTSVFEHFNEQRQTKSSPMNKGRMLTTRQLAAEESTSITREINEGLNALPRTATEKEDCSLILTPQQLHHIVIGPSTIDFGEVCVNSTSVKEMNIINSLPTYIWVQVEIDCVELQQTSPLSHVVLPMSKTEIPVVFETNTLGKFKKSISYTVNNKHIGCILVTARAVPIALELSSHELVLKPNNDFLAETGFRSSIRLYNRRNHAAEFSWKPIITEKGIAFSIRPARGIVDAYEDLECEVVWHPGFSSPDVGEFNLCVQRSAHKLKCIAELGSTNVQFTEQRILFHRAPLGLSTIKTAIIQNTGANHAYFQVVDISPLPGMTITPSQGVVPVGGHAALTIFFTPRAVIKFDTRIEVSVRNAKTLALRIGGSVVPPEVDISVSSFLFPGVYVNSTQAIPFMLQNKGVARARVEFDLSRYEDFYLTFKEDAAVEVDPLYPQLYTLDLEEKEALECSLHFSPKEVAAYDFQLPVNINFTGGLSDADSSAPVTPTHSEKHIVIPRPQLVNVITPACKVNATVLQQIFRLSTNHIAFELPSGAFDLGLADDTLSSQVLQLSNISKKQVSWRFNLDQTLETLKNGIFKFSKRSGALHPGETSRINVHFCPGKYKGELMFQARDTPRHFVQIQKLQHLNEKTADHMEINLLHLNNSVFQSVSKRVWTDILLQIYKVFILSRVTQRKNDDDNVIDCMPKISSEPLSSNIYSTSEIILLTWLNVHYEKMRKVAWRNCKKGDIPATRWIMNFDKDLLDGLVLAAQVAAYCPYLILTHFISMYTNPETPEQCLHNCLILVSAFRVVGLNIDIQATDICDPNPVTMLMLCVYLHENLPLYVPKKTITFDGALHQTISRQVRLKNPSSKPLTYQATIVGRELADFLLPKENTIKIAPKSQVDVTVEYKSRFLHPAEATMLLAAKPISGAGGTTLSFSLQSRLTDLAPTVQLKQESPCYELEKICLSVESPYKRHGKFRVILLESSNHLQFPTYQDEITKLKDEKSFSMNSTDHDLSTMICDSNNQDCKSNLLRQYFCPVNSIFLKKGMSTNLQVNFLPFELGKRYCAIIFTNEEIGDFVYMIEGMGTPPLPSTVTPVISPNVFQMKNGNTDAQNICYFKCKENSRLEEDLKIPLVNERREKALALAAQMQMTLLEYERRKVTGTLESSSVRAAVASSGGNGEEIKASLRSSSFSSTSKKCQTIDYDVEISMAQYFEVPRKISIPVSTRNRVTAKSVSVEGEQDQDKEKGVLLPVKFFPEKPGRYTCKILLRSYHDVRVYMIECVVNPCSTETELEFITPACEALIQDIPICNMTQQDWKLKAILQVDRFYGPPFLYIPAGETAQYPLLFKPTVECCSMGTLILQNETDGTEHIFGLRGIGQEPLALDHIVIDCQVRQITQKVLMVPNYTNDRLTFKVASDIPIIGGSQTLTVKPGTSSPYTLSISPWKRGLFQGVISFVAGDGELQYQCGNPPVSADGTEAVQIDDIQIANAGIAGRESAPYKVWFSVEINSMPAPPERTIDVTCSVLKSVGVNIPITNPTMDVLNFHVLVNGDGITGDDVFTLQPRETFSYVAKFSPTKTGISNGSVIFQCEAFGEFWYNLVLTAEKPDSVTIPEVFCELGKWMRLSLPLVNPTQETYELYAVNCNPEHFLVELDGSKPLSIPPNSTTEVPVQFCPSSLGKGSQTTSIAFKNPQLEEWAFHLSGVGLIPQPMEPASLSTTVGSLASINISFKNPTNENVLVDVILTDQEQTMHRLSASVLRHSINKEPAFCLPLKQTQGIPLFAKEKLDIPILFAPDTMKLYEALLVVHMVKADGDNWDHGNFEDINTELKSISKTEDGGISGIRWIYPIHGIPEAQPSNFAPAVVSCQARCRTEERVEVLLTGVAPGQTAMPASSQNQKLMERTMAHVQEEVQVSNGFRTTEEFLYEIRYESEESKSHLEPSVGIELVRKERDTPSGIVTLIFNIIFAPNKSMRHSALLVVQCVTGGIWKFPIHFVATEPNVDDVIQIEAVGLNKESAVGFRLTSQTRYPEPFSAYFIQGSDLEFSVSPQSGELLPLGTAGTLITVGFKPSMYSKKHRATLVVQSSSMQWTYEINGLPPKTTPPTNVSPKICSLGMRKSMTCQKRNFLRENLKLTTTAVSSPVKGASLMFSTK
ncbi:cilia- and flagella-associated protein 47 [Bufo gargarizans]|uniref:cilia- and flagella-associated protein 47 n=1 Tax=Bufo gargarizans TaxID=30331 RepID=UPI001CF3978F|nr:cilia- and flagella-associated protein 47 [Bufo gargarizans]